MWRYHENVFKMCIRDRYRVPVEEFFTERRNRLLKYFTAILSRKLNDEKMPFAQGKFNKISHNIDAAQFK